jgi:primary-amine oxidase
VPGELSPYGEVVNPCVLAANHQHIFSIRIDPAIDGHNNTVVQEDVVTMPWDPAQDNPENPFGTGFVLEKTLIKTSGWADAAPQLNRVFKITNQDKINPISGKPVAYKLVPNASQLILSHPDSIAWKRAQYGEHHLWVTAHRDGEVHAGKQAPFSLWPLFSCSGGQYTNQSTGSSEGLRAWAARGEDVYQKDLVVWHTFALTHMVRIEDFPVVNIRFSCHRVSLTFRCRLRSTMFI